MTKAYKEATGEDKPLEDICKDKKADIVVRRAKSS